MVQMNTKGMLQGCPRHVSWVLGLRKISSGREPGQRRGTAQGKVGKQPEHRVVRDPQECQRDIRR